MKSFWTKFLLLAILQATFHTTLGFGGGHHDSGIAHLLAAGIIVHMLSNRDHHKHHHHGHHHHGHHHQELRHHHPAYASSSGQLRHQEWPIAHHPQEWPVAHQQWPVAHQDWASAHQESRTQPDLFAKEFFDPWGVTPQMQLHESHDMPVFYPRMPGLPRY